MRLTVWILALILIECNWANAVQLVDLPEIAKQVYQKSCSKEPTECGPLKMGFEQLSKLDLAEAKFFLDQLKINSPIYPGWEENVVKAYSRSLGHVNMISPEELLARITCVEIERPHWIQECKKVALKNLSFSRVKGKIGEFDGLNALVYRPQPFCFPYLAMVDCKQIFVLPESQSKLANAFLGSGGFKDTHRFYEYKTWGEVAYQSYQRNFDVLKESEKNKVLSEIEILERIKDKPHVGLPEVFYADKKRIIEKKYQSTLLKSDGTINLENGEWRQAGIQILTGLAFLHSQGIVHADVKPQNILLSRDPLTVVLSDFGLSYSVKRLCNLDALPKRGSASYVAGEVYYRNSKLNGMSCEKKGELARKTDIYSLALTLVRMRYNKLLPWEEDENCQFDPRPCIQDHLPKLIARFERGDVIDRLIARALSKNPEERPNLTEFQKAFEQ